MDDEDRDIIDVATTAQGHLDWVRDLIAARAPEIDAGQIADAYGRVANFGYPPTEPDPGESVWLEVAERVIDTIEALESRLDVLERTINGGQDDDDEPRDQRQASGRD